MKTSSRNLFSGLFYFGVLLLLTPMFGCAHLHSSDSPTGEFVFSGVETLPFHDDNRGADVHNVVISISAISQTRVWRVMDGTMNLALPMHGVGPIDATVNGVRDGYQKLPNSRVIQRFGELCNALQIRQLCLLDGDTFGHARRTQDLIDWFQDILDDLNEAPANWVGARRIIPLTYFHKGIDGAQLGVDIATHTVSVVVIRQLDHAVYGYERVRNPRKDFEMAALIPASSE